MISEGTQMRICILIFGPKGLTSKSDRTQFSPNNINTSSIKKVMGVNKIMTKGKCCDLLSYSPNGCSKEM